MGKAQVDVAVDDAVIIAQNYSFHLEMPNVTHVLVQLSGRVMDVRITGNKIKFIGPHKIAVDFEDGDYWINAERIKSKSKPKAKAKKRVKK